LPDGREYYLGQLKGFEEGLNKAWDELIGLTTKGYTPREIQVMAKSKRIAVSQMVQERRRAIMDETGLDLVERGPAASLPKVRTSPGNAYIVHVQGDIGRAVDAFRSASAGGEPGLCISRRFPGDIAPLMPAGTRHYWLTRQEGSGEFDCISPSDMGQIVTVVRSFMKSSGGGVVMLEGAEYLMVQNEMVNVLKFLQTLVDLAITSRAVLLLPIRPGAVDDKAMSNLECNISGVI